MRMTKISSMRWGVPGKTTVVRLGNMHSRISLIRRSGCGLNDASDPYGMYRPTVARCLANSYDAKRPSKQEENPPPPHQTLQ